MIIQYACPECDKEWTDTWPHAVNATCPHCGTRDIEPLDTLTLAGAFDLVLSLARAEYNNETAGTLGQQERLAALELVTAFYLLNVKGS